MALSKGTMMMPNPLHVNMEQSRELPAKIPLSPMALLAAAAVRWRTATFLALFLGATAAAGAYVLFPAEYATASLLQFRFGDFLIADESKGSSNGKEELENRQRSQIALIKSWRVLDAAANSDPRVLSAVQLTKDLKVSFSEGTSYMVVYLSGLNAQQIAASVNAVTEAFLKEAVESERRLLLDKSEQLGRAITDSREAILKKKQDLRRLTGGRADDPRIKAAEADLQANSIELTRTQLDIERHEGAITRAKSKLLTVDKDPIDRAIIEESLDILIPVQDAQAVVIRAETAEAEVRRRFSTPDAPRVLQAVEDVKLAREALQKLKAELSPRAESQLRRKLRADMTAQVAKDEEELASLRLMETSLRNRRDAGANTIATGLPPEIEIQVRAIEQDEKVLADMNDRRERLRIELQSGGPRVSVFQTASVPGQPNYRGQYTKVAIAAVGGCAIGWFLVGLIESRSRRIRDVREIAVNTSLRILGAIPASFPRGDELLAPKDAILGVAADLLRTTLQLDDRLRTCRVLVITSAMEQEGKSSLALLLAGSLARAGFRTLLIDGDFRSPTLSLRLGIPIGPGLGEYLTIHRAEEPHIVNVGGLPLDLLPAGGKAREAVSMLARTDFQTWFNSLRTWYEYVIIDSPPVLPIPDAAVFGKAADGVILCARAGKSRIEQVHEAVGKMTGLGIHCLGLVLNEVRGGRPNYYGSGRADPAPLDGPSS